MRFSFKVLCAFILVVLALLFALNGWRGVLASIALLCMASAFLVAPLISVSRCSQD